MAGPRAVIVWAAAAVLVYTAGLLGWPSTGGGIVGRLPEPPSRMRPPRRLIRNVSRDDELDGAAAPPAVAMCAGAGWCKEPALALSRVQKGVSTPVLAAVGAVAFFVLVFAITRCCRGRESYQPVDAEDEAQNTYATRLSSYVEESTRPPRQWVEARAAKLKRRFQVAKLIYLPPDRQILADMLVSTTLYYLDILSDVAAAVTFFREGDVLFMAANILAIVVTHTLHWANARMSGSRSHRSSPYQLCKDAYELSKQAPEPRYKDGEPLIDSYYCSRCDELISKMKSLQIQMHAIGRTEALIEAPVSGLIQFYAWLRGGNWRLLVSFCIGLVSQAKALATLETYGETVHSVATDYGEEFHYVSGTGASFVELSMVGGFRVMEISSRMATLATMQHAARFAFPTEILARFVMLANLAASCAILAVLTTLTIPRHLSQTFAATFAFPSPVLQPMWAKVGPTSALTHYRLRAVEVVLAWFVAAHFFDYDLDADRVYAVCDLLENFTKPLQAANFSGNYQLSADCWGRLAKSAATCGVEEVEFKRCALDGGKATAILEALRGLGNRLKKVNMYCNPELRGADWWRMCDALASAGVEHVNFNHCGISDAAAAAIAAMAGRIGRRLRGVDLGGNPLVTADGWQQILTAVCGSTLQEIGADGCALDAAKAGAIARALTSVTSLRVVSMDRNAALAPSEWAPLLDAVEGGGPLAEGGGPLAEVSLADTDTDWSAVLARVAQPSRANDTRVLGVPIAPERETIRRQAALLLPRPERGQGAHYRLASPKDFERLALLAEVVPPTFVDLSQLDFQGRYADLVRRRPQELNLMFSNLGEATAASLAEALGDAKASLRRLNLGCNRTLQADGWAQVLGALGGGVLEELDMNECDIDLAKAAAISGPLGRLGSTLKRLNLSLNDGSDVPPEGWAQLLGGLAGGALERLDLERCGLEGEAKAAAVGGALGGMRGALREVDLSHNKVGPGWGALLGPLAGGGVETLYLAACPIGEAEAAAVGAALGGMKARLKSLALNGNPVGSAAAWGSLLGPLEGGALEVLQVHQCGIDDEQAEAIGRALAPVKATLKYILAHGNRITPGGLPKLLAPLAGGALEFFKSDFDDLGPELRRDFPSLRVVRG